MNWFNIYGLIIIIVIMVPNIIFFIKHKDSFDNLWHNKAVETLEQIGRFGCFGLMVFNIPFTWFGFFFIKGLETYIIVNAVLVAIYCIGWTVLFNKNNLTRAILLSVVPSVMFLFSGIMIRSVPLIVTALIFAPCHITISCKNAMLSKKK